MIVYLSVLSWVDCSLTAMSRMLPSSSLLSDACWFRYFPSVYSNIESNKSFSSMCCSIIIGGCLCVKPRFSSKFYHAPGSDCLTRLAVRGFGAITVDSLGYLSASSTVMRGGSRAQSMLLATMSIESLFTAFLFITITVVDLSHSPSCTSSGTTHWSASSSSLPASFIPSSVYALAPTFWKFYRMNF